MSLKLLLALLACATPAVAHPGWGIVVNQQGSVFFTNLHDVYQISPEGRLSVVVSHVHTHDLYLDSAGNLYGENVEYESAREKWLNRIWRRAPDGTVTDLVPRTDQLRGLAPLRDNAGNMYWVDQNNHTHTRTVLVKRSPDGEVRDLAGGTFGFQDGKGSAARFGVIGGITVTKAGEIYLLDGDRLRHVAPDGTVSTLVDNLNLPRYGLPTPAPGIANPRFSVRLDPRGDAYVTDWNNHRIVKVALSTDRKISVAYESGSALWSPTGLVFHNGDLYVLEYAVGPLDSARVIRVRNGQRTVIAKTP